ncbi:Lipase_3 domain-containing protein [Cephalotus follicularis]|uniref:Lipase_3 domain-containing protein n=1 Tax=Cephalotus follicularis TaxID=3775 RepID=A0A1Q3D9C8_CEPFO|nr:Lipase_3 domain-containing protein [Cephalotus follicularis]
MANVNKVDEDQNGNNCDYEYDESRTSSTSALMSYLVVRPENGGLGDLLRYMLWGDIGSGVRFLEGSDDGVVNGVAADHRWVILVSIILRKFIAFFRKPMEYTGYFLDFFLNLLSLNGNNLFALLYNLLHGTVVIPKRGTETFTSTIGQIDGRFNLQQSNLVEEMQNSSSEGRSIEEVGEEEVESQGLMDLCMMASKLAYENAQVVRYIINHHWKMNFVDFYNCWNDYQKEKSTQVFILCDKHSDANVILISFRGTEPFDADDWSTDFDYSWYEIPKLGKVHMGFLEALGLGNRADAVSFQTHLQTKDMNFAASHRVELTRTCSGWDQSSDSEFNVENLPEMELTAYYTVRRKLKSLFKEHKNAKFLVTGHSLGGALAILFPTVLLIHDEMELIQRLLGVYTFGQPRIGDRQLGRFMEAYFEYPVPKYFRIVYCDDLVPRLPYDDKNFLYKHFGVCLYYNSCYFEQKMNEEPNKNFFGPRYWFPEHLNAVWELIRSLMMHYIYGPEYKEGWLSILVRLIGLALPGISAHCPTDYVNSVRLGKERSVLF